MSESPFATFPDEWKFKTLKEILENPPPASPPWKIRGMMADGCGTMISSHPHGMKSYTWLQAMIEASLSIPVWGHFPSERVKRSLFLETEDPEWMVGQRVHRLAKGMGIKVEDCENCDFVMGNLGPFDLVKCRDHMRRLFDRYKPDAAVLSTLQGLLGGRDWKEQSEMQDVNGMLVNLSHEYCPLSVITHSPWDKKQKRSAGTVTQAANYQNLLHYEKFTNFIKVKLDSKLGEGSQFRIKVLSTGEDNILFRWASLDGAAAIADYLAEHLDDPAKQIAEHFGCTERYIRQLRSNLKENDPARKREHRRNKFDVFQIDQFND
jgi:hypothetical protein